MTIESGLRAYLMADSGVAALVADRIYPAPAPQGAVMPFVTWQRISGLRVQSLGGPSGLAQPTIQLDCWAETGTRNETGDGYGQAKALAQAVRQALDGKTGILLDGMRSAILLLDERDLFEGEARTVRVSMDFRIWHEEA